MKDLFHYKGKRVVINGAASGMGEATTRLLLELGAEVYALDIKEVKLPVEKYIPIDVSKKESIDAAVGEIPDSIDRVFTCAGLPPGPPFSPTQVIMVNFVGNRYMVEALLPRIVEGGAIAMISSIAGWQWQSNLEVLDEFFAIPGFEEVRTWLDTRPEVYENGGPYLFSKQCLIAYGKGRAGELAKREVRINTVSPAPTDTPMLPAFQALHGKERLDKGLMVGRYATAEDMAHALVFLNSDMAAYISGVDLAVDFGAVAGRVLKSLRHA